MDYYGYGFKECRLLRIWIFKQMDFNEMDFNEMDFKNKTQMDFRDMDFKEKNSN